MMRLMRPFVFAALAAAGVLMAQPAFAGPPLLCEPFQIGHARSLPMGQHSWRDIDPTYDVSRLVDDTLALLGPQTPLLVRMETLRRATIYASTRPPIAGALLGKLEDRSNGKAPFAAFDYGYLVEALREAEPIFKQGIGTTK
jgi:hypothetical protein